MSKKNKIIGPTFILMMVYILGVLLMVAIAMSSCSVEKRYNRMIKKHPELVERDTTWVHDTTILEKKIPVPEYRDSFIIKNDTVIETERLIVTKIKDKFHIVVKADTLMFRDTITKTIAVAGKVHTKKKMPWYWLLIAFSAGVSTVAIWSRK